MASIMKNYIELKQNQEKVENFVFDKEYHKKVDLKYVLNGKQARLKLCIILLASGCHKTDINIKVLHIAEQTHSKVQVRSALFDDFSFSCFGSIEIEKGAKGSEAFLELKALLFSKKAHAKFDPSLQIRNKDVKAYHAATIGTVSDRDIFYLRSRGLSRKKAEKILLKDYFSDLI